MNRMERVLYTKKTKLPCLVPIGVLLIQFHEGLEAPLESYRTSSLSNANPSILVTVSEHSRMYRNA